MNPNDKYEINALLLKVLLEEATTEEKEFAEEWLAAGKANQDYYRHFRIIWESSRSLSYPAQTDVEGAWERFLRKVENHPEDEARPAVRKLKIWHYAAAALIIVSLGTAINLYLNKAPEYITVQSGSGTLNDTLPDGSVVSLNKSASITYSKAFGKSGGRHVTLQGEAFFRVVPDPKVPFTVSANAVKVKVLGTSFNVKSMEHFTEVIVKSGVVEVEKAAQKIVLQANDMVKADTDKNELVREKNRDALYDYYFSEAIVCQDIPLHSVIEKLNDLYGVHIIAGNQALMKEKINTVLYASKSLPENLHIINLTMKTSYTVKGDTIVLK